ncbi:MAG: sensor histidine kinase [Bacteroidetes bacterium]|nr:MAG: sensor histidine kinase [Bacteroidota bacterium]REJ99770.1 MAG: sensor histidine kinase [Bacteroidota bacterium]REK34143.1 MAG: sensor histidine kinase [Bacteroidota bacterium]REK50473.1 MAG: sensor histidine kinase [Bacteroidota bacterium]
MSKAIIILAFGLALPVVIEQVVYNHVDDRLNARLDKMTLMIERGGVNEIALDQDCSFSSYNIFKEEYVAISPLSRMPDDFGKIHINNSERNIENEILKHRVLSQAFIYDNQLYNLEIGEGISSLDHLTDTIREFTLRMMLIIILIFIFLDFGFVQILLRPFRKITSQKLRNIRHPENFVPMPIQTSTTEFIELNQEINEMMKKIQLAFRSEREFITNVSHELLTPVSILRNRIENLMNESGIPNEVLSQLAESQKTLSRLTRVVRAFLYISKIENDQYLKNESVNLHELTIDVISEVEERLEEKQIKLEKNFSGDADFYPCNKSLIHTLIFNIIANAIKYSLPDSKISVTGVESNSSYKISIADEGVGIEEQNIPHIFDRFRRFRPDDTMSFGLGLPIVKTIAEFHGISIEVIGGKARLKGTEFIIGFPKSQ